MICLTFFIAAATLVTAQSISDACKSALTSVATNPNAGCLNPSALVSLAVAGSDTSLVDPIDNWLKGLCSSAPCSNDTIASVVTNITAGCSTDLGTVGASPDTVSQLIPMIQGAYPTVRQIVCLQDSGTNCITQTLTNIQNMDGTLSINNIVSVATKLVSTDLPANVTCTNCAKAAYNLVSKNYPSLLSGQTSKLQSQCGANFTDGQDPAGIKQTASDTSSPGSSALAVTPAGLASSIAAIMAVFAFVA